MYGDYANTKKPAVSPCRGYEWEKFDRDLKRFGVKEDNAEKMGLTAVFLLIKGKYITQLTTLLQDEDVPKTVKLLICNFLLEERYSETHAIVEKTLVDTFQTSLKEWRTLNEKTSADTL